MSTRWKMRESFFKGEKTYRITTDEGFITIDVDCDGYFELEGALRGGSDLCIGIIAKPMPLN